MKRFAARFALCAALIVACNAHAATMVATFKHPPAPQSGPKSLVRVMVYYGTCIGNEFGRWEGGKSLPMPRARMTFEVPYRRTCGQTYWQQKNGTWLGPSPTRIAEAP
jgi:hypothetical protein